MALEQIRNGMNKVSLALSYSDEESSRLSSLIEEEDLLKSFRGCFKYSLEEEDMEVEEFVYTFKDKYGLEHKAVDKYTGNHTQELVNGLGIMVKGAEEIVELTDKDKEARDMILGNLEGEDGTVVYNPFRHFGIIGYYEGLKEFRDKYIEAIKK